MSDSLPPGITSNMIPGNSYEDQNFDLVINWIYEIGLTASEIQEAVTDYAKRNSFTLTIDPPI